MRRPSLSRLRLGTWQVVASLSLVVAALGILAAWTWRASMRRHDVAMELLRSHAELAAQRLGARIQDELYLAAVAGLREEPCECGLALRPVYTVRTDLTSAGTAVSDLSAVTIAERTALVATLRRQLGRMPPGWRVALLRSDSALRGRLLLFHRVTRDDEPGVYAGFATDSATVRALIVRPLLCNTPLVSSGGRTRGMHNDSLVAVRITDAAGVELYRTPWPVDPTLASTTRFPIEWGELAITASLRPLASALVLPGGVPRSPVPMLVALVSIATALVAAAALLIWRTHELGRLRADFTSSVSHELRTPLTQILLYAETIEMGRQRSPAKRAEAIGVITRETRRLIHLVENVLQYSRTERSLTRLNPRPQEIGALVADTIAAFTPVAESRGSSVAVRMTEPVHAFVDSDAMRRVLLNLLDNAVRYGPAEQTITVAVERAGAWARVVVEDEGPGVPTARRRDIWRPFVRLDESAGNATTGCGIGLAIVSELVARQGGRRGVSDRAGGGACFFVELPAVEGAAS